MGNPILFVKNAGYGETPLPADALLKPGDELQIHDDNDGTQRAAKVGVSVDIALADQSGQPRPLMLRVALHKETLYVLEIDGREVTVKQSAIAKGLAAALDAGLHNQES